MGIHPGLLIAGGVGALGLGYVLLKGDDKPKDGADPASKDPSATAGAVTSPGSMASTLPTAGTQAGAVGSAAQGPAPAGEQLQGQQVGPYTIVPDPASGAQLVFETATQQPIGILDEQGNLIPLPADATGGQVPRAVQSQASPAAPGIGAPAGQEGASTDYARLAAALFADAGDPSIGTAASDAVAGAGSLAPPAAMPAPVSAPVPASQQAGPYTLVADPASGGHVVVETATQQPVGTLDATGRFTELGYPSAAGIASVAAPAPAYAASGVAAPAVVGAPTPGTLGY